MCFWKIAMSREQLCYLVLLRYLSPSKAIIWPPQCTPQYNQSVVYCGISLLCSVAPSILHSTYPVIWG